MPDLTIESHYCCKSVVDGQRNIGDYNQTFGFSPFGKYQYAWDCTCKGFQFRKTCKHVKQAETEQCGWDSFFHTGEVVDGKCPRCQGEVTVMRHAV
jgi:hypothetical protein